MKATLRVLLMDDNPDDRMLVARTLRQEFDPLELLEATENEGFKECLRKGDFDLVITDYQLHWTNGLEVLRAVKGAYPCRPVIMFTATGSEEIAVEAMKEGLQDYVLKSPKHFTHLIRAVRAAVERHEQKQAIEQAEQRYQNFFEGLSIGVYRSTPEGRLLDANPALVRVLGYPDRESLLQARAQDLYPSPEAREDWRHRLEREGEIRDLETHYRLYCGKAIWVRENARAVMSPQGEVAYYEGTLENITARKQAEQALQESEERLLRLSSSTFEGIGIHDRGRILDANERLATMFGLDLSELIGSRGLRLVKPESRRLVMDCFLADEEKTCEVVGLRKDGTTVPVELVIKKIPYHGRNAQVMIARDITERKRAIAALRESEQKYSNLFQQSSDGIMICELDGKILDLNQKAEELLDYSRDELLRMGVHEMLPGDHLEPVREEIRKVTRQDPPEDSVQIETHLMRQDGEEFPAEISASYFEISSRRYLQIVVRDIGERRRLETQLRQAQRMEAVGRLAGGVAHDFNNLLTLIGMHSDLLLIRLGQDNPLSNEVLQIKKAGERAATLTRQLLAFSRQQILRPQVLNLNDVITDLWKMVRRLIGEDIELDTYLNSDLGHVRADPSQIEQVIMNLVVNSRDAMPHGGRLVVETCNADFRYLSERPDPLITLGSYVQLTVTDDGVGMDEETLGQVFEPFFSTKEQGKGTGLGLSTVYGIVKQSGGFIFADSKLKEGTTFRIYLPRVAEELQRDEVQVEDSQALCGAETILVVEDEDPLRTLVGEVLRTSGYTVHEACNGAEAVNFVNGHQGPIHLTLTDVVMPGMSSKELSERLASARPQGMKILYMSGYSGEAILQRGRLGSDMPYLEKPFTAETLAAKVREVLDEGSDLGDMPFLNN